MKWFMISPFSVNVLNVAVMLLFMIYFLSRNRQKSPATRYLIAFLSGVALVFLSFFLIFASLATSYTTAAWWILHGFVFASVAMVQFAYCFPENLYPRESRIALIICVVASVLVYPYYVYRTLSQEPDYSFEGHMYVFFNTPEIGIVIGLEILWVLIVFFRKAAAFSGYNENASANIWARVFKPQDRRGKAIRALLIIFVSPVPLVLAFILAYQGLLSWEFVAHILGTGFMVVVFAFVVVYINSSSEPSTFMIKLVGISLGAVLIVLGLVSNIALRVKDAGYDAQRLIEVEQCTRAVRDNDFSDLSHHIAYMAKSSTDGQFQMLLKRHAGISLPEGILMDADGPTMKRQYRRLDVMDAARYFIHYDFTLDATRYEVGYAYVAYREYIHRTCLPLIAIVLATALFVVIVFPAFFNQSLVRPMNMLLSGVRKVNDGDLRATVPIRVEDEIGFLSKSFNNMVHSIRDAQNKLQYSLDNQVNLTNAYSCFVPREFLMFLEKDSVTEIKLGDNVQKEMTLLFSDIRSFTTMSETMTPQENFNFINEYLGKVGPLVRDNNGFIDKYMGDSVMALFPTKPEDALKAALEMLPVVKRHNEELTSKGCQPIRFGLGIHTGPMMLGIIGEEKRMEGTVIADAVNLASRMEGLTKDYGGWIIVSGETLELVEDVTQLNYRYLDSVRVKGKRAEIDIYEIFDNDFSETDAKKLETKHNFESGVALYKQKKFADAARAFQTVAEKNPGDKAALFYIERCEGFQKYGVPDGWKGITSFDHK